MKPFQFKTIFRLCSIVHQLRGIAIFALFLTYPQGVTAESSADEKLRKIVFKDPERPSCEKVPSHPSGAVSLEIKFNEFVLRSITAFNEKKGEKLAALFHPKLKFSQSYMEELLAKLTNTYGPKWHVSLFRLWALNTGDGSPLSLKCKDPDIKLSALYGYNLQFGLWLQIMGLELGRIYLPIVYAQEKWYFGGLHSQQWTHIGKSYSDWMALAQKNVRAKNKVEAYFQFDIAKKLAFGDKFFELDDFAKIESEAALNMSTSEFEAFIKSRLPGVELAFVSPLFAKKGLGLLLRIKIPREYSLVEIKSHCTNLSQMAKQEAWAKGLTGLRCSYILPKENPMLEGSLGGMFVDF